MLFLTGQQPRIMNYFIPALGPAPGWVTYLDNLTEELEESKTELYDDYKFVTKEELAALGMESLIGTKMAHAYMHGFWVDAKLYKKAKAASGVGVDFHEHRRAQKEKRRAKKSMERIVVQAPRESVAVNQMFVDRYHSKQAKLGADGEELGSKKKRSKDAKELAKSGALAGATPLNDDRFKAMFMDKDFEIDTESTTFKLINPGAESRIAKLAARREEEEREYVSEDEEEEGEGGEVVESSSADDDDEEEEEEEEEEEARYGGGSDSDGSSSDGMDGDLVAEARKRKPSMREAAMAARQRRGAGGAAPNAKRKKRDSGVYELASTNLAELHRLGDAAAAEQVSVRRAVPLGERTVDGDSQRSMAARAAEIESLEKSLRSERRAWQQNSRGRGRGRGRGGGRGRGRGGGRGGGRGRGGGKKRR
jgi:ribosome biogenesis protein ENP2